MVSFKGRLGIKQLISNKPVRFGIKPRVRKQVKKKNVSQANTLVGRNESDLSSFPGRFTGKLRGEGEGEGGGALLGPLFRSNVWKFLSVSSPVLKPRGGLDIFTYRDQRSISWVLNFEDLYFFFGTGQSCCIFGGCQTKAVFLRQCLMFSTVFF